ncbi:MAG: pirin-like C-terminal cupin domain-containing protein [Methylocella sp.]
MAEVHDTSTAQYGPIVMKTDAELEQTYAELRDGTFIKQRDQ